MNKTPKISIILPTWKKATFIDISIESVLSQTFSDWELIIIDDGLINSAGDKIKKYLEKDKRIIFLKNESNIGIQKTLNRGLYESKGEYIARIDDDDAWTDVDKLKKQAEFLDNNKDYGLVGMGGIITVDEDRQEIFRYNLPEKDKDIRKTIISKNCFVHSSVLFRSSLAKDMKGYSEYEETKHIEDYDLWLRLGQKTKLYNLPYFSIEYMLWNDSISSVNKIEQFKKNIKMIKKYRYQYPNFIKSLFLSYLKLWIFSIFSLLPVSLKNKILKINLKYYY